MRLVGATTTMTSRRRALSVCAVLACMFAAAAAGDPMQELAQMLPDLGKATAPFTSAVLGTDTAEISAMFDDIKQSLKDVPTLKDFLDDAEAFMECALGNAGTDDYHFASAFPEAGPSLSEASRRFSCVLRTLDRSKTFATLVKALNIAPLKREIKHLLLQRKQNSPPSSSATPPPADPTEHFPVPDGGEAGSHSSGDDYGTPPPFSDMVEAAAPTHLNGHAFMSGAVEPSPLPSLLEVQARSVTCSKKAVALSFAITDAVIAAIEMLWAALDRFCNGVALMIDGLASIAQCNKLAQCFWFLLRFPFIAVVHAIKLAREIAFTTTIGVCPADVL